MKKIFLSAIIFVNYFIFSNLQAQNVDSTFIIEKMPPAVDSGYISHQFINMLDFNIYKWAREKAKYDSDCQSHSDPAIVADSVYISRLKRLPWIVEMPYNAIVRNCIDLYTVRRRNRTEEILGMSKYYFPIFEEVLAAKGMPLEIKYLPVIESALEPTAASWASAAGLWQFIVSTGRYYGLEINSLVDERLDPIKSTYAATEYLKDLYKVYGNWHLAIAAYNCGPNSVRKAMVRSGGKTDYWAIYPYLPAETRSYVPIFIAANYAFEYATEHNLCPRVPPLPPVTDTLAITEWLHLEQVASVLNLSLDEIKAINPQYRQNIIPGSAEKPYMLQLPLEYIEPFVNQYDSIIAFRADELINNRRSEIEAAQKTTTSLSSSNGKTSYHTVKHGQTLGSIAARYGVSVSKLKSWNSLHSDRIREGQKLKIQK